MSEKLRKQFLKETGNKHMTEAMGRYNPVYVEWLEQRLVAGQVDAGVMQPITIWESFNKKKQKYEHNHIEDGHLTGDTPIGRTGGQKKAWDNTYWRKKFGYLKGGKVVETEIAY